MAYLYRIFVFTALIYSIQAKPFLFKKEQKPKNIYHIYHVNSSPHHSGEADPSQSFLDSILGGDKDEHHKHPLKGLFGGGDDDNDVIHHYHTYDVGVYPILHPVFKHRSPIITPGWNDNAISSYDPVSSYYPEPSLSYGVPGHAPIGYDYHKPKHHQDNKGVGNDGDVVGSLGKAARGLVNMLVVAIKSASEFASKMSKTQSHY